MSRSTMCISAIVQTDATDSGLYGHFAQGFHASERRCKSGHCAADGFPPKSVLKLIILADGESDDGYPADEVQAFKDAGGTALHRRLYLQQRMSLKRWLAKGGNYTANNADELKVAIDEVTTKVAGLISDPMGDGAGSSVPGSSKVSGEGYEKFWAVDLRGRQNHLLDQ